MKRNRGFYHTEGVFTIPSCAKVFRLFVLPSKESFKRFQRHVCSRFVEPVFFTALLSCCIIVTTSFVVFFSLKAEVHLEQLLCFIVMKIVFWLQEKKNPFFFNFPVIIKSRFTMLSFHCKNHVTISVFFKWFHGLLIIKFFENFWRDMLLQKNGINLNKMKTHFPTRLSRL